MGNPNIAQEGLKAGTRFPVNRQNHTQKGPYFLPALKRFLKKQISYEDPETQKIIKGTVKDAILWRLILNASQGDNEAIKEILNRIDGKNADKVIGEGFETKNIVVFRNPRAIEENANIRKNPELPAR